MQTPCRRKECKNFSPSKRSRYCSHECRNIEGRDRYRKVNKRTVLLPKATLGAVSELRVASDLLARGYDVFRAVSPVCSCDLVALKNGNLHRVEVRTGNYCITSGKVYVPLNNVHADVLAVVLHDKIVYKPALE
jgi:hypothetical protein